MKKMKEIKYHRLTFLIGVLAAPKSSNVATLIGCLCRRGNQIDKQTNRWPNTRRRVTQIHENGDVYISYFWFFFSSAVYWLTKLNKVVTGLKALNQSSITYTWRKPLTADAAEKLKITFWLGKLTREKSKFITNVLLWSETETPTNQFSSRKLPIVNKTVS